VVCLRVAAFQTAARALVVPAFAALAGRHPRLACELVDQEAEAALPLLRAGDLDVVVAEEYAHAPRPRVARLVRHLLGGDELLVALRAGHPASRSGGPVELAELAGERWATPWAGTAYATMVAGASRAADFEPDVRHRVTDLGTLLDLARRRPRGGNRARARPPHGGRGARATPARRPRLHRTLFAAVRRPSDSRPAITMFLADLRERVGHAWRAASGAGPNGGPAPGR
jgi:DNA-binding transcriptional LysR family regulator